MLKALCVFFALLGTFAALAQVHPDSIYTVELPPYMLEIDKSEIVESAIHAPNYSLSFDTTNALSVDDILWEMTYIPKMTNDMVKDRLSCIENIIPLHYNERVQAFIDFFTLKRRDFILRVLERKNMYFPLFEKIFAEYGIPDEMKYLSIVESALVPTALSRAGARGLWQFMPSTARLKGLKQDYYFDERLDPEKSTRAAASYLLDLYRVFGDWELAISAYNCGPGNIRKAQKKTGKLKFWDIFPALPTETRSYLPQFVAITYVLHYADEYQLINEKPAFPIPAEEVYVSQAVNLQILAKELRVCLEDLRLLNLAVHRDIIPPYVQNFPLRIPKLRYQEFLDNQERILQVVADVSENALATNLGAVRYHIVRKGETLSRIAQKYGVSIAQLKVWNQLRSSYIKPGRQLVIYTLSYSLPSQKDKKLNPKSITYSIYTVRSGDSLWQIAQKYGVTVQQLKEWNQLKSTKLEIGQKLKVRPIQ
ncbi:MAG: LysM peptidoglycan-binding domain-containing protein [Cytophagales bacterium]|nr:LysM peptidoglycan-binding domain-containing protein [Cytophagales bacterium]MDW8383524.1 LysM peptidoglycan-binding domain-containing protein [Flammeovirgaceae bacterium]